MQRRTEKYSCLEKLRRFEIKQAVLGFLMKTVQLVFLTTAAICGVLTTFAQTWTQTSASTSNNWWNIASSADGSKLIAATAIGLQCGIYISTNSGSTWVSNYFLPVADACVASSADGTILAVLGTGGANGQTNDFCISTNSGASWTFVTNATNGAWSSIAMSADGTKLVVVGTLPPEIVTSTNSGAAWTPLASGENVWGPIASSADGTKLVAAPYHGGAIYTSTNSGISWTPKNVSNQQWECVVSSADGNTLVVASPFTFSLNVYTNHNSIYVSTNSGATWTTNFFSDDEIIYTLACSADGKQILAGPGPNPYLRDHIFISTNFGTTWTAADSPTNYWHSICSSADGSKLMAVVPSGGIWTAQTTPTPMLQVSPEKSSATLSWTVPSTNFVLQQNSDLTTTNWTDVTNTPVLNLANVKNQVTLPMSAGNSFYRLKTP